ncbi:MAG: choice-of-anchor I family protein, partial [Planctomycetota bacterium]
MFDESAAEIPAFDAGTDRLFVSNADSDAIDVLDLSDPTTPTLVSSLVLSGGSPNSVAVSGGVLAVAVEQDGLGGRVDFYNAATLGLLSSSNVGALPDALAWSPDGSRLVVANEGEPTSAADPVGSISVLDFDRSTNTATARTADFSSFDAATLRSQGVRIFPGQSAAADLEPEFVSIAPDGARAFVTLQEANAIATVDLATATVTGITTAGMQDHSVVGLDASDRDGGINIATYDNLFGLRMPDAVASFTAGGTTFYMTANEGDDRGEDERVADLVLDPTAFPNAAALQADEVLGRLGVSTIDGDTDGDGDFDQLFAYGSRSFTIYDDAGNIVFDSGDDFEQITAAALPDFFNANNDENGPDTFESRSDNKGPEPEGIAVGEVDGRL